VPPSTHLNFFITALTGKLKALLALCAAGSTPPTAPTLTPQAVAARALQLALHTEPA
jgi:hypothetical protein